MMPTTHPDTYLHTPHQATLDDVEKPNSTIVEPFPYPFESDRFRGPTIVSPWAAGVSGLGSGSFGSRVGGKSPRACYEPALSIPAACWRKRQANATKWSPATVSGS